MKAAKNEALNLLRQKETAFINAVNFIDNGYARSYEIVGNTIIIRGFSDRNWVYICCNDKRDLPKIKKCLNEEDKCFVSFDHWLLSELYLYNKVKWQLSTDRLVLKNDITVSTDKGITKKLDIEDAKFIYQQSDYQDFISIGYIENRIRDGESAGIYKNNQLVAWGITQDDGAIGFLHVINEERRKGYAKEITIDLINQVRKKRKIPFVHVESENLQSMKLVSSFGFEKDRVITWFEIE